MRGAVGIIMRTGIRIRRVIIIIIPPTSGHGGLEQLLSKYINIRDAHARLPGASPGAFPEHFRSRSWGTYRLLGGSKTLTGTAFRAHGAFLTTP